MPAIERAAGEIFRGSSQDAIADDDVSPARFYLPLQHDGLVWVAEDADKIIGFGACERFQHDLHLWQIAVLPDRQGKGVGRGLIDAAVIEGRRRGLKGITLTTFRDIPWNGPAYARMGFVDVTGDARYPRLTAALAREATHGLDIASRIAMRRPL